VSLESTLCGAATGGFSTQRARNIEIDTMPQRGGRAARFIIQLLGTGK